MDFEKNLKEIERIAEVLEEGKITLEEGIELFEKSVELTKVCTQTLNQNREKIEKIKNELAELTDNFGE
jgi:exodeoxyribonuclease VII small subunit